MADNMRGLATRAEVAEYLGLQGKDGRPAVGTLAQWAHRGVGPRYVRVGRHTRYRWADVEQWLNSQQTGGGGAAA